MDNAAVLPTNLVFSAFICCSLRFPESANIYITDSSPLSFASNIKRLSPTTPEFSVDSVGVFVTTYNNLSLQINCWRYEFLICGQPRDQDHSGMIFSWSCNFFSNIIQNKLLCISKCLLLWGFEPAFTTCADNSESMGLPGIWRENNTYVRRRIHISYSKSYTLPNSNKPQPTAGRSLIHQENHVFSWFGIWNN